LLELLNKVSDLGLVLFIGRTGGAKKSGGRFGFGEVTVLLGWGGHLVSFCRTVVDIEDYFWGLGIVALKLNL
jgi:hypothetical protein